MHKISFVATNPGLYQREDGSEQTEVIEGKTELCVFKERAERIVLSPFSTMPTEAIFSGLSTPF